jgi:hypothetical protein
LLIFAIVTGGDKFLESIKNIHKFFSDQKNNTTDTTKYKDLIIFPLQDTIPKVSPKKKEGAKPPAIDEPVFLVTIKPDEANMDIFVNNKFMGKSDKTIKLKKGSHEIKLVKDSIEFKDVINIPEQSVYSPSIPKHKTI